MMLTPSTSRFRSAPLSAPTLRFALLVVGLVVGLAACRGSRGAAPATPEPPPVATTASFRMDGTADMNAGGNSVRVYVYALSSDATFLTTPSQVFWDDPAAALGADLLSTLRDATVRPGETAALDDVALGSAAFIGIAADLREPVGSTWRVVLPVASVRGRAVAVTVTEGGLRVGP